jgi:hypothetical protein
VKHGGHSFVALNEADGDAPPAVPERVEIAGQVMYSRAYSQAEVTAAFKEFTVAAVGRGVVVSEMFGRERSMALLLEKRIGEESCS